MAFIPIRAPKSSPRKSPSSRARSSDLNTSRACVRHPLVCGLIMRVWLPQRCSSLISVASRTRRKTDELDAVGPPHGHLPQGRLCHVAVCPGIAEQELHPLILRYLGHQPWVVDTLEQPCCTPPLPEPWCLTSTRAWCCCWCNCWNQSTTGPLAVLYLMLSFTSPGLTEPHAHPPAQDLEERGEER